MPDHIQFGAFSIDRAATELCRGEVAIKLAPQPLRVLALLASRQGEVVSREEIRREIWGDSVHVDFETGLNSCIKQVRHALGDAKLVETVPKRGYRLKTPAAAVKTPAAAERKPRGLAWFAVPALAAVLAIIALEVFLHTPVLPKERRLIAVAQFENLTPSNGRFADGLTEETITQLTRLQPEKLAVVGRGGWGVDYVLRGSVRGDGGRVRISAQLIQVSDQTRVWAATYEREQGDALKIQARVAGRIARSLGAELLPGARLALARAATSNSQAYEAYLGGQRALALRNDRGFEEAVEQFSRAVREDPNYAMAYAGLADAYSLMGEYYLLSPDVAFPKAREAALHALDIDDSLGEAETSLALVKAKYEWDWPGAEARFRRAIELNASYATTHQWYAELLSAMGRHEEAIAEIERARRLDAASLIIQSVDGYIHYNARRYDDAIAMCRAVLARDPHYAPALEFLMLAYERKGMDAEIPALVEQATAGVRSVHFLASDKLAAGKPASRPETPGDSSPYSVAARYAVLGRRDLAFRWLDLALERHDALVTFAKVDPNLDPLRGDARFGALLRRVGLSSY